MHSMWNGFISTSSIIHNFRRFPGCFRKSWWLIVAFWIHDSTRFSQPLHCLEGGKKISVSFVQNVLNNPLTWKTQYWKSNGNWRWRRRDWIDYGRGTAPDLRSLDQTRPESGKRGWCLTDRPFTDEFGNVAHTAVSEGLQFHWQLNLVHWS